MRFELQAVELMPAELEPGVLYVSDPYSTAAHLCACGCGSKIRTPLGPTEWTVTPTRRGPSLWPSVGNWQKPCRSHYVIEAGEIIWCRAWTQSEVAAGRRFESLHRETYYARPASGWWARLRAWLAKIL
jgi:Family of unknown function (DUF6527)